LYPSCILSKEKIMINDQRARPQPRAVLWDVDGTLLDSAEYHWLAWQETMAAEGHAVTYEQFISTFGQRNETILHEWLGPDLATRELERIAEAKERRYRHLIQTRGAECLPGVRRWLERLHQEGWRQAVASSAPLLNIQTILGALGIGKYFDAIASSEDVQRGKPDPQVFLAAAAKVAVPPQCCIVVEDAPAGIEGARRAGMRTIGVCSSHATLQADWVVRSLDELPDDAFDRLLNGRVP
jgi:beta-phosphoglucomutase